MTEDLDRRRRAMVERHLRGRGLRDDRVLAAMGEVRREAFLPADLAAFAYEDSPLEIGHGQTISQPYMVAAMLEAVDPQPGDVLLDVGTGSGYAAAVAARLVARVVSIERIADLAEAARARLARLGVSNVEVHVGDGSDDPPGREAFDAIVVAAGGPDIPPALAARLAPGGRLVMPVGSTRNDQTLVRVTRRADGGFDQDELGRVSFVPLIGKGGWHDDG